MTSLAAELATYAGRCSHGFDYETQHPALCQCDVAEARKRQGIAAAERATPERDKARIDIAIARLAASGREFSANDCRREFGGVSGGVIGGRFNAAAKSGLIRDTGKRVPSTLGNTHGHEIRVWIGT